MQNPTKFSAPGLSSNQYYNYILSFYNILKSIEIPNHPLQESRVHSIAPQIIRFVHSYPVYIERLLELLKNLIKINSIFEKKAEDGYAALNYCTKHFIDCFSSQISQTFICEDEELTCLIENQNIPIADLLRKAMILKLKRLIWKEENTVKLELAVNKILNFLEICGCFNTCYLKELVTYILSDNSDHPGACISGLEDLCYIFFGEYQSFNAYRTMNLIYMLIESMKYRLEENTVFESNLTLTVIAVPKELRESIFLQVGQEITFANNKDKSKKLNVFGKYVDGENLNKVNFDPIMSNLSQIHMCIVNLDDGFYCIDTSYSEGKDFYRSIVWKRIIPNHPIALQAGMIIRLGKIQSSQIFEIIYIDQNKIGIYWNKGDFGGLETKEHLIERNLTIGRRAVEKSDILLNDEEISRNHARFELIDGKIYLRDLNSTNFTYFGLKRRSEINSQEFSAFEKINDDDVFSINDYKFRFQFQD